MNYRAGYSPTALATLLQRYERTQQEDSDKSEYRWAQLYAFLLGNHPPTAQRSLALTWESNFVKLPQKQTPYKTPAFDEMKQRLEYLDTQKK